MMKPDERILLLALAREPDEARRTFPRDVVQCLGMSEKRAEYILNKWERKGWFESGVSLGTGWLTSTGYKIAQEHKDKMPELYQRTGILKSFDDAFDAKSMDEATVNAAVDWLTEQGS